MEYPRAHQWKVEQTDRDTEKQSLCCYPSRATLEDRVTESCPFPVSESNRICLQQGSPKAMGTNARFLGGGSRKAAKSVNAEVSNSALTTSWHYSDPKPSSPISPSEARTDVWASLSIPPEVALTPAFSVSRTQELDSYQDLCAPHQRFPPNFLYLPKGFYFLLAPQKHLVFCLRLMFLIERIESRRNVSLKRYLGPFFSFFTLHRDIPRPPLNMSANPCPQKSHKNNLETQGFTQLEVSIVLRWPFFPQPSPYSKHTNLPI